MTKIFFDQENIFNEAVPGKCELSNGLLTVHANNTIDIGTNVSISSGKIYWEIKVLSSTENGFVGIVTNNIKSSSGRLLLRLYNNGIYTINYTEIVSSLQGCLFLSNDVIGIALDALNKFVDIYINGVYKGNIVLKTVEKDLYPAIGNSSSWDQSGITATANFGETQFMYPIPQGYRSWYQAMHPRHFLYRHEHFAYGMGCLPQAE